MAVECSNLQVLVWKCIGFFGRCLHAGFVSNVALRFLPRVWAEIWGRTGLGGREGLG